MSILLDNPFLNLLLQIDQTISKEVQVQGCPHCGGILDVSNYPRKPRGLILPEPEGYHQRLSFCCRQDGCRKRVTPRSVRFLGEKCTSVLSSY